MNEYTVLVERFDDSDPEAFTLSVSSAESGGL